MNSPISWKSLPVSPTFHLQGVDKGGNMATKQKPAEEFTLKDVYNSYYWLVTKIDPYYGIPATPEPLPRCVKIAIKEIIMGNGRKVPTFFDTITIDDHYRKGYERFDRKLADYKLDKHIEIIKRRDVYTSLLTLSGAEWSKNVSASIGYEIDSFIRHLDEILLWHANKGIPAFPLSNGGEINSLASIKKLWEELKLQPFSPMLSEIETPYLNSEDFVIAYFGHGDKCAREIKAHFLNEHNKNIETLEQVNKDLYTTQELIEVLVKETGKSTISYSYFTKIKSEVTDFPDPINPDKVPHLWKREDVPKIVEIFKQYFEEHPKKPPTKKSTKTKKR